MLVIGTPSACFMPAINYTFSYVTGMQTLVVPVRGEYPKGAPREGFFDICPEPGAILFGTLLEVLFGFGVYPKLAPNQRFVISGIDTRDEGSICIVGKVIEFMEK